MKWALALVMLVSMGCGVIAWPGKPCRKHEDCTGIKDGYCSRAEICTRECSDTLPCPENSSCSVQGARSVCLPKCAGDGECMPGFGCVDAVCVLLKPMEPPAR